MEKKNCKSCKTSFDITDQDLAFYDKMSPVFNGEKQSLPTPTLCPFCRNRRRFAFRNERNLYKRKCDFSWEEMICIYSPDKPYTVYEQAIWWSDTWDAIDYGRDFDFSRPFFDQFDELLTEVPKCNLITDYNELENSPYVNLAWPSKNAYLIFETDRCENTLYSYSIFDSNYCVDSNHLTFSENCYECLDIDKWYNLKYCSGCNDCRDCTACIDCNNLKNCFGCTNLNWWEYLIYNKQYTKDEYLKKLEELKNLDYQKVFKDIKEKAIYKETFWAWNTNVTHSDYITNSENISYSYDLQNCRDCKYCIIIHDAQDCMDYSSWWAHSSKMYECQNSWFHLNECMFCNFSWDHSDHMIYCDLCTKNNSYLFGCVWLRNKKYCILNKQYTKKEYEELVPKIIEHMRKTWEWWEFFPGSISQFWYNETVAHEHNPLSKEQALALWFRWNDYKSPDPKSEKIIPANKLPDSIKNIPDDILNWAIKCEVTQRLFKIVKPELDFYRRHNLPIPKRHPNQRHLDRIHFRNPRKLFKRKCDKCNKDIDTTFHPDRKETVYCWNCYNEAIY